MAALARAGAGWVDRSQLVGPQLALPDGGQGQLIDHHGRAKGDRHHLGRRQLAVDPALGRVGILRHGAIQHPRLSVSHHEIGVLQSGNIPEWLAETQDP